MLTLLNNTPFELLLEMQYLNKSTYPEHCLIICLLTSAGNAIFKQQTFISTYAEHYLIICLLTSSENATFKQQILIFNNMPF